MKKKDLKKLTARLEEIITNTLRNSYEGHQKLREVDLDTTYNDDYYRLSEYDKVVSDKFKKLILNLLEYTENIGINVNNNRININTGDLNSIKKKHTKSSSNYVVAVDESSHMEITINKESFYINKGYSKRTNYKDSDMYSYLFPIVTQKLQEINSDNFNEIWTDIMKESGLIRDNNLDNLLGD